MQEKQPVLSPLTLGLKLLRNFKPLSLWLPSFLRLSLSNTIVSIIVFAVVVVIIVVIVVIIVVVIVVIVVVASCLPGTH